MREWSIEENVLNLKYPLAGEPIHLSTNHKIAMKLSSSATTILEQITANTKLGDIRNIAKRIKTDHGLAMELWSAGKFLPRMLAILIMDNKLVSKELINDLDKDMYTHPVDERNQLMDWLMANQLTKNKKTIALIESWENSKSALQRRTFWYYQGRLRWTGQTPPANTPALLTQIEANIAKEDPAVQWAMNFTAGWIGIYDKQYRARCIAIGETTKLYKGDKVSKGCTPNYLPEFIAIESGKRGL
ncbi:DNA alkylation repair protein [Chitinophaga deserti]|uniref:DNA alkylation repair protein n=1 Tax=Chitinophaga deserti TaxID=2164099 RepID=UPI0018E4DE43|nr:DNA alkylation repair protein [Chitinophaga deserti]